MSLEVAAEILETMSESSGAMHFTLLSEDAGSFSGMIRASEAVRGVPHPDEPSGQLASFVSEVTARSDPSRFTFWADISDMEEEPEVLEAVRDAIVDQLEAAEVSGTLNAKVPDS